MSTVSALWDWASTPVHLQAMDSPSLLNPALWSTEQAKNQGLSYTGFGSSTGIQPAQPQQNTAGGLAGIALLLVAGFIGYKLIFKR